MLPPPSHICPKCREPQVAEAFINAKGEPTKWCSWCRATFRNKFIKPKKVVAEGTQAVATEVVARVEGYKDHPLAKLLALSHIAGAKRALAIRDGRSWKGKKAWRAYNDAKRELDALLTPKVRCEPMWGSCALESGHAGQHSPSGPVAERDPKSEPMSSK